MQRVYHFLSKIFHELPYGSIPLVVNGSVGWRAYVPTPSLFNGYPQSWYYSCASHYPDGDTYRRGRNHFAAAHVVVLDDVGTKAPEPPCEPSYRLETSAGNFQYGYVLRQPCEERATFERFMAHLADGGWTDAGSTDCVHLFRLPGSVHRTGFRARMIHRPTPKSKTAFSTYALDELIEFFGVNMSKRPRRLPRAHAQQPLSAPSTKEVEEDKLWEWLQAHDYVPPNENAGYQPGGWAWITCPWNKSHTVKDTLARYLPGARAFKCFHEHCVGQTTTDFWAWCHRKGFKV